MFLIGFPDWAEVTSRYHEPGSTWFYYVFGWGCQAFLFATDYSQPSLAFDYCSIPATPFWTHFTVWPWTSTFQLVEWWSWVAVITPYYYHIYYILDTVLSPFATICRLKLALSPLTCNIASVVATVAPGFRLCWSATHFMSLSALRINPQASSRYGYCNPFAVLFCFFRNEAMNFRYELTNIHVIAVCWKWTCWAVLLHQLNIQPIYIYYIPISIYQSIIKYHVRNKSSYEASSFHTCERPRDDPYPI